MKKLFVSLLAGAVLLASCKVSACNSYFEVTHAIEYELNSGEWVEGYTAPSTFSEGKLLSLPDSTKLSRAGMCFDGWYDNASLEGDALISVPSDKTEDIKLYAKWIPNQSVLLSNNYTPSLTLSAYNVSARMPSSCLSSAEEIYKFGVYVDDVCLTVIKTGSVSASYNFSSYAGSLEPGSHVIMVTVEIFGVPGSYSASKEFSI